MERGMDEDMTFEMFPVVTRCWAKVKQKSCEPKTIKNVTFRYTGSRKMSISYVTVVVEKNAIYFGI